MPESAQSRAGRCALVLYTAAHGGFAKEAVPLGGGAAVYEHLVAEWSRTHPFDLRTITPSRVTGRDLVRFGERDYARFSRAFECSSTDEILQHDPERVAVLVNDISEGPDFETLGRRGYKLYTIYHVDVVAYVADIYLRGLLRPETTVRWARRLRWALPDIAGLIWQKQEASVRWSQGLVVPSAGMKDVLLRCYPDCPGEKIHVLPWGNWNDDTPGDAAALRQEFAIPDNAKVLLTLSRISPEKGQDLLLDALRDWEPPFPVYLFLCGDAAFMQGRRFLDKLKQKAAALKHVRAIFPGYVTGERKRSFFSLADLYVFPSRHESYGLTLLEALACGLPAVCLDTAGARSVMRPEFGELVGTTNDLREAIARLLLDNGTRATMGEAARAYTRNERFAQRAERLARLVMGDQVSYPV